MGQILFFEPQRVVRRAATADRDSSSTAAIIIFPGVRYERQDEAVLSPRAKAEARVADKPGPRPSRR